MADPMPYADDARIVTSLLAPLLRRLDALESPTGTQMTGAVGLLLEQTSLLEAASRVVESVFRAPQTNVTALRYVASVQVASASGRVIVDWGGSLSGGSGMFVFDAAGSGGTIQSGQAMAQDMSTRVGVWGGTFSVSGFSQMTLTVPIGEPVTYRLGIVENLNEAGSTSPTFQGGRIAVRPAL